MKAKIFYEEISAYVKNHYKVKPELKRIDDKTIEAAYKPVRLLPAIISIQFKIEEVREDVLCIKCGLIEKVEKVINKVPHGIDIDAKSSQITLYFSQIEKTKKVMEHIKLENVYVNEDGLELTVGLK